MSPTPHDPFESPPRNRKLLVALWMMRIVLMVDIVLILVVPYSESVQIPDQGADPITWVENPIYSEVNMIPFVCFLWTTVFAIAAMALKQKTVKLIAQIISMVAAGFCLFHSYMMALPMQDSAPANGIIWMACLLPILVIGFFVERAYSNEALFQKKGRDVFANDEL